MLNNKVVLLESKRVNFDEDYTVVLCLFNNREFVTWLKTGENNYCWGNYFPRTEKGLAMALENFNDRVEA